MLLELTDGFWFAFLFVDTVLVLPIDCRYSYYFPFLDTQGEVGVDNNCVGPLYEHVFPPSLAPSLAFVGLPWKVMHGRASYWSLWVLSFFKLFFGLCSMSVTSY